MTRRRDWRVNSLIISTNSDLSVTAGSLAKAVRKGQCALCLLTLRCQNASLSRQERLTPLPDVDKVPGDRRGRGHSRRHQVGAALKSLAALEIAVRGRSAALFRGQLVG